MSNDKKRPRTSIEYTELAHARLKELCREFDLSQPDIISLILERITKEAIAAPAKALAEKRKAEQARMEALKERFNSLSPEQQEKLLLGGTL